MSIQIEELYRDELICLDELVDWFGIPGDVMQEYGTSYLSVLVERQREEVVRSMRANGDVVPLELEGPRDDASDKFDRFCKAVGHLPRDALASLSLAYASFAVVTKNGQDMSGLETAGGSVMSSLKTLMSIAMMRGAAMGHAGMSVKAVQRETARKKLLSDAGRLGAKSKHKSANELKMWAESEARNMRGSDIGIARRLSVRIPDHLANASVDPQRLIYEHLRKIGCSDG